MVIAITNLLEYKKVNFIRNITKKLHQDWLKINTSDTKTDDILFDTFGPTVGEGRLWERLRIYSGKYLFNKSKFYLETFLVYDFVDQKYHTRDKRPKGVKKDVVCLCI
jgi:hypothetical protein